MGKSRGSGRGTPAKSAAIMAVLAALAAAPVMTHGAQAAQTSASDWPSAGSTIKRVSAPKGSEIRGLNGFNGHVSVPRDWRQGIDKFKRFDHTEVQGTNGRILRVISPGRKSATPPLPRIKPILAALSPNNKLQGLGGGPTLLKPGMRPLGWPISGSAISSGYGLRTHPIRGGKRWHQGVDLPAPYGTPVRATADGTIGFKGRNGGYGRFIRVDHGFGLETAYGHLEGYAQNLRWGGRVQRGEVIGYVGSSGLSTGPHLHYEVRIGGRTANPVAFLPAGLRRVSVQ